MGTHLRSNTDGAHAAEQVGTENSLPPTRTVPCGGVIRSRKISGEGMHRKSSEGRVMPPHMLPSPKTGLSLISWSTFPFHCESAGLSDGRNGQNGDGAELTDLAGRRDG
ncbi:MAG: hypothetical protein IJM65_04500 [Bacteroidales bacterium]|nr:hypothetical protein [Bacteroidales bacterium]